jgi:type II secretory pathway pseudopilin PulG
MSTSSNESKQRFQIIAGIIIGILLIVVAILIVNNFSKGKKNRQLGVELNEAQQLNDELQMEFENALAELDKYKGDNEELNLLVDQQQEELSAQRDRIEILIKDSNNLKEARRQLSKLIEQRDQYLAELTKLKEENEMLTQENQQLSSEKASLTANLESSQAKNQELSSAKAALTSEKESLEEERRRLSKKVNRASVIELSNIDVTGQINKGGGKWKDKDKADKINRLKICFDMEANDSTEEDVEQFFVRIINPQGETLAMENMGSGVMVNAQTQQKVRYTSVKEVKYNNQAGQACTTWAPGLPFQEGTYDIEIYNKGFLAGKTTYELK